MKILSRASASQAEKAFTFARAYESLTAFRQKGDLLSAYVLGFSIIEDRIRAMFVTRYRHDIQQTPSEKKTQQSLTEIIRYLYRKEDLNKEIADSLIKAARERNQIIHAAMWRLDSTTLETVKSIVDLGRQADLLCRKQKRKISKQ